MNGRTIRNIALAVNFALALVAPLSAYAQTAPTPPFNIDEVRAGYIQAGFVVEQPIVWWSEDQVTTMRVTDPHTDRVLMIVVYPDGAKSDAARWRIQKSENEGSGRLVRGYGISAWIDNVALVESTRGDLNRLYDVDQAREFGAPDAFGSQLAWQSTRSVDADILTALDRSIVNL